MTVARQKVPSKSGSIVVSNRLPVIVSKENGELIFTPSPGGLAGAVSSVISEEGAVWIGWPGIASDDLTASDKQIIIRKLRDLHCIPVFLTQKQVDEYYDGYSNKVLWPLFHYFQHLVVYDETKWLAYQEVNKLFHDVILLYAKKNATIWVHDYHLMLLPSLLRASLQNAAIGFFLHIPFPPFEIFRLLSNRLELLEGMLGADLVGFHTYDYTQHFISSVLRTIDNSETKLGSIIIGSRTIRADAFPVGIDYQKFAEASRKPSVQAAVKKLKSRFKNQRIIASVDRLDYTKGIVERLEAFDLFLDRYPQYRKKVTLAIVAVPSREEVDAYKQLRETAERAVSRINGTYSTVDWSPISYQHKNLPFEEVVALYAAADVAFVTPLRDGMNLVAKEFIASKQLQVGSLILSEMAGAANELPEALRVNPYDGNGMAMAIEQALTIPVDEQKRLLEKMQARISDYSLVRWASDFLEQLAAARKDADRELKVQLKASDGERMRADYKRAKKRLFLLDYDGTLRGFVPSPDPDMARPSERLLKILRKLAANPKNVVCIISGRTREALEGWFSDLPITLVAEHGAWRRKDGEWVRADIDFQASKAKILPILTRYAERTPGAVVEKKDFSLVWHYRNVTHGLAYTRNANLRHELAVALEDDDSDTMIFDGNKVIEVKPRTIHKGAVVEDLLSDVRADFIFCAGDDYTDEDMFNELPKTAWSIKVGMAGTKALYRVNAVSDVIELLGNLSE